LRTLHSGKWGRLHGPEVAEFENRFAAMHDCKHGIAVVNGTVSLRIALQAAGIRPRMRSSFRLTLFFSTASAVIEANAIPVFADIALTRSIFPKAIEAIITPRNLGDHSRSFCRPARRHGCHHGYRQEAQADGYRGRSACARGKLQEQACRFYRAHRIVLISVQQEHDGGRGRHPHHER
jgi:hypothetical protein